MSFRPELAQVQGPRLAPAAWRQQPWPQQPQPSQPRPSQSWPSQPQPPQAWPSQPRPSQPQPSQSWPSQPLPSSQPWSSSAHPAGHSRPTLPAAAPMRTPYGFAKAFACAAVIYVVATGLLLVVLLGQLPSDAAAWQFGNAARRAFMAFPIACVLPAFITGVIVHWSSRIWPLRQVAVTFLPMFFLVAAIQLIAVAAR